MSYIEAFTSDDIDRMIAVTADADPDEWDARTAGTIYKCSAYLEDDNAEGWEVV